MLLFINGTYEIETVRRDIDIDLWLLYRIFHNNDRFLWMSVIRV